MRTSLSFLLFTSETAPTFAGDGLNALLFAKTLQHKNCSASIICYNPNKLLPGKSQFDGVFVERIPYWYRSRVGRLLLRFQVVLKLLKIGKNYSYWIIYGAVPANRVIIFVGWVLNRKVIFRSTLYGFDDANSLVKSNSSVSQYFNAKIYGTVYGYYALNRKFKDGWTTVFNNKINVFISPQGIDFQKYQLGNTNKHDLRTQLKLPQNKTIILMIGHLINRKGFPQIFEWLSRIKDDFLIVHVGRTNAPAWDALSSRNSEMHENRLIGEDLLGDKILFAGESISPTLFYYSADIFLMASFAEGFPSNSVNEAMATGLPILSRRIEGCGDCLFEDENSLIFENEADFGPKLGKLINNSTFRAVLGENARKFAVSNNLIEDVVGNFLRFFGTE